MASFKDSEGNEYRIKITVSVGKSIRDKTGVDLIGKFPEAYEKLVNDPYALCNIAFLLAKHSGYEGDEEKFCDLQNVESMEAALNAVVEAVTDFFPTEKREKMKAAIRRMEEIGKLMATKMEEKATEAQKDIEAKLNDPSGELLTSFLESAASTPTR